MSERVLRNTSITEVQFRFAKTTDQPDADGNEQVALFPWITCFGDISHMLTEPQLNAGRAGRRANIDAEETEQAEAGRQGRENQIIPLSMRKSQRRKSAWYSLFREERTGPS